MDPRPSLRQRGWSELSSGHSDDPSAALQRPRADSQMTCDTDDMSPGEKRALLESSAFDGVGDVGAAPRTVAAAAEAGEDEEGEESLAVEDDDEVKGSNAKAQPPKKRRKTGEENAITADEEKGGHSNSSGDDASSAEDDGETGGRTTAPPKRPRVELTATQQEQLDLAKNKLSKWAARLFDPNRPRGLVEAPKVIPLNDEFLTAFGKREKEYDEASGRVTDIDKTSLDVIDISDDDDKGEHKSNGKEAKEINFSEVKRCKVKISNLSYRTTSATIARTCGTIGPVVDVNVILDENGQSSGRAFVVFEDHATAIDCAEKLNQKSMEGRTLYVTLAAAAGRKSWDPARKQDHRYWERDVPAKPPGPALKPCGLCGATGHDLWSCPQKSVCFNCGVPGHVTRDCNRRRGMPARAVCTNCGRSGHQRFQCRERPASAAEAVCLQCGQKGHTMCAELRWFFGLKGASCFNCGGGDHTGYECQRPNIDTCLKAPDAAFREISRAGAMSLGDQLSDQRSSREARDGAARPNSNGRGRARSVPPQRPRGNADGPHRRF